MTLIVENIKVRYRNGAVGVLDVSLEVNPGEVVVLSGPNGAGKTTTVRAATGFLKSEHSKVISGKIAFDGKEITNLEPHQIASRGVAFVPERSKIFPSLSVSDNLEVMARRPSRSNRTKVYREIFDMFPMLEERQQELAGRLSGGQQQMLAIARSVMCDARLLIIDEITLGLHHSVHGPLFEIMRTIASQGKCVLFVDESSAQALQVADRSYIVNGGVSRQLVE
ncbi:MAG: ATP-binding cassette domain-containing protein [Bacteroidota bacterium]